MQASLRYAIDVAGHGNVVPPAVDTANCACYSQACLIQHVRALHPRVGEFATAGVQMHALQLRQLQCCVPACGIGCSDGDSACLSYLSLRKNELYPEVVVVILQCNSGFTV